MEQNDEYRPSVRVDDMTYDNAVGVVLASGYVHVSAASAPWNHMAEHAPGTWENVYFDFPARGGNARGSSDGA